MNHIINPFYYNIIEECRIIVLNTDSDDYYNEIELEKGTVYNITDDLINQNPDQFMYKIEIKKNDEWINVTECNNITKNNYELFPQFMIGKVRLSNIDLENTAKSFFYYNCDSKKIEIKRFLYGFLNNVWNTQNVVHPNIYQFLNLIYEDDTFNTNNFWNNFNKFLKHLIRLKRNLISTNTQNLSFYELKEPNYSNSEIETFLKTEIVYLNEYNLPFTYLLSGIYQSFLHNRNEAYSLFEKAIDLDEFYMQELIIGQGIFTYQNKLSDSFSDNKVFIDKDAKPSDTDVLYLISVDIQFLRKYYSQLVSSIIALKNQHFHIHVVGDDAFDKEINSVIEDAKLLMYQSIKFRHMKHKVIIPTFSYEYIPAGVPLKTTYYACARYIQADYLMKYFDKNIYIMDIDLFVINDLSGYISSISNYDLALPFSRGLLSFTPWRRILAGNVFVKNNDEAKKFLNYIKSYILSHIFEPNSWTLDQNALTYAYEKIISENSEVNVGNLNEYNRPLAQHPIRKKYEE